MRKLVSLILALTLLSMLQFPALMAFGITAAAEEVSSFHGHSYQLIKEFLTWEEAKAACEGMRGYLAVITSQEEMDFVAGIIPDRSEEYHIVWIGGTDRREEGLWEWVTGEPFAYANWKNSDEPNNYNDEDYLQIDENPGWNDAGSLQRCWFLCEKETAAADVVEAGPDTLYQLLLSQKVFDMNDIPVDAQTFLGKPALFNVWATWCGPCVGEIPALGQAAEEFSGKLNIVGIQLDAVYDDLTLDESAVAAAQDLFANHSVHYTNIIPNEQVMGFINQMEVSAIPTTWVLDMQGIIVGTIVGSNDLDGWRAEIEQILAQYGK